MVLILAGLDRFDLLVGGFLWDVTVAPSMNAPQNKSIDTVTYFPLICDHF